MLEKNASCVGFNEKNHSLVGLWWAFLRDFFLEVILTMDFCSLVAFVTCQERLSVLLSLGCWTSSASLVLSARNYSSFLVRGVLGRLLPICPTPCFGCSDPSEIGSIYQLSQLLSVHLLSNHNCTSQGCVSSQGTSLSECFSYCQDPACPIIAIWAPASIPSTRLVKP